jgi:hypothetical protein
MVCAVASVIRPPKMLLKADASAVLREQLIIG